MNASWSHTGYVGLILRFNLYYCNVSSKIYVLDYKTNQKIEVNAIAMGQRVAQSLVDRDNREKK